MRRRLIMTSLVAAALVGAAPQQPANNAPGPCVALVVDPVASGWDEGGGDVVGDFQATLFCVGRGVDPCKWCITFTLGGPGYISTTSDSPGVACVHSLAYHAQQDFSGCEPGTYVYHVRVRSGPCGGGGDVLGDYYYDIDVL
jgi:hypothetical protein